MPRRKRIQKFPSDEVQGKGSWALVAKLTVTEMRAARNLGQEEDFDAFELGVSLIATHVREWNWVDDEGNPMLQPKDNPEIVESLTDDEIEFLGKCIQGSEQDAKN